MPVSRTISRSDGSTPNYSRAKVIGRPSRSSSRRGSPGPEARRAIVACWQGPSAKLGAGAKAPSSIGISSSSTRATASSSWPSAFASTTTASRPSPGPSSTRRPPQPSAEPVPGLSRACYPRSSARPNRPSTPIAAPSKSSRASKGPGGNSPESTRRRDSTPRPRKPGKRPRLPCRRATSPSPSNPHDRPRALRRDSSAALGYTCI